MTTNIIRIEDNYIISEETNYQGFIYDCSLNKCSPKGHRTILKWKTLESIFPLLVKNRSFLDIGANFGFFCFKALEHGCSHTIAIEAYKDYYDPIVRAIEEKGLSKIKYILGEYPKITGITADVVMGISLVHHLFAKKYSLEKIVENLFNISNRYVIVEWIDRNDAMTIKHGFLENHPEYNKKNFEDIISINFSEWNYIGEGHHPTRFIYLLTK